MTHPLAIAALSAVIALLGALAFIALSLPLPWMLGPIFALLIAALLGAPLRGAPKTSALMRTILGVAIGASITPAVAHRLDEMAQSLVFIPVFIFLIGAAGYPYFRRLWGFDKATSFYAAMPGGLQDMLLFGEEAGGDVRAMSLIHATRVLVIVTALPMFFTYCMGIDLTRPPGDPAASFSPLEGAYLIALALAGWWAGIKVGLPGASILGPMILTAAASLSGLVHHRPPAEALQLAQYFIGLTVGVRYVGLTLLELRRFVLSAIGFTAILAVLTAIFMEAVLALNLAPFLEVILAFSPGGQAEMAVIAIIAGADIAYVVTHHLSRLVCVIIGAPIAMRFLK